MGREVNMPNRKRVNRVPLDYGNTPANPLSSYRMSMLSHGFLPTEDGQEYLPDESGPMTYGVVLLRKGGSVALVVVVVVLIGFFTIAFLLG